MKNKFILFLFLILLIIPFKINALTENEARKIITDYAYYLYSNKKSEIVYVSPKDVELEKIYLGFTTKTDSGNKYYAMDCNAFVSFILYNALQMQVNSNGKISQPQSGDGYLTSSGRVALNGYDGWSSHSSYYSSKSYRLSKGQTIQSAVSSYDIINKLEPGDLIGVIGYSSSSYSNLDSVNKSSHIMLYLGNGKYIHNRGSGVGIDSLDSISYGSRMGSSFADSKGNTGPHGSITILKLKNFENLSAELLNSFRFPDGIGNLVISKISSSSNDESNDDDNVSSGASDNISNTSNSSGGSSSGSSSYTSGTYVTVTGLRFCERSDIASSIRLIGEIIKIIRIIVPIILIVSCIISMVKAIINVNENKNVMRSVSLKAISAVMIFLVPTFISIILKLNNYNFNFEECLTLAKNPKAVVEYVEGTAYTNDSNISTEDNGDKDGNSSENNTSKENNLSLNKNGTYITLKNSDVTGYYFSNSKENISVNDSKWISSTKEDIDFVLLPGEYYIYSKNSSGSISEKHININTSDIVVTNDVADISLLKTDLSEYLLSKGSSLEQLNDAIARSVYIAGGSTKSGAAAASLALTQILYKNYKIKIPYGNTHGVHLVKGAVSSWGSTNVSGNEKKAKFNNVGIHCGGFVSWSYYQANFSMNSGIGSSAQLCRWSYGDLKRITNSNKGSIGDVLTYATECDKGKHVAVINAIDSIGYYYTEANASLSVINEVRTLTNNIGVVTSYSRFSENKWKSYLDMTKTVNGKAMSNSLETGF